MLVFSVFDVASKQNVTRNEFAIHFADGENYSILPQTLLAELLKYI